MTFTFWKKFNLSLISFLLIVIFYPTNIINACAGDFDSRSFYTFISPDILKENKYQPFYLGIHRYSYDWRSPELQKKDNLEEWYIYFKKNASKKDIEQIIYKTKEAILKSYYSTINESLKNNSLIQHLYKTKDKETVDYLIFAKQCEPHVKGNYYWGDKPKRDSTAMDKLIKLGEDKIKEIQSPFIKLRYAYQIIRLAHYGQFYQKAIRLFDQLVQQSNVDSIIKYWAMEHKAGALWGLGEIAQANYLFSVVFDQCKSKSISSFLSFHINTDKQWNETISFCKTNREKSTLHFIRALDRYSNAINEMKAIYKINPSSDQLEFLLIREINKLERDILGSYLADNLPFMRDKPKTSDLNKPEIETAKQLKQFIEKVLEENKIENIELWKIAYSYNDYLANYIDNSEKTLLQLKEKSSLTPKYKNQIQVLELVYEITKLKKVDTKVEQDIYSIVKDLNYNNEVNESLNNLMLDVFQYWYKKQGEYGKAFLCHETFSNLLYHPKEDLVNNLLELVDKQNKTLFEEYLISKLSSKNQKERLLELKGTILLGKDRLKSAIKIFKQLPSSFRKDYSYFKIENNPFDISINDTHKNNSPINKPYTKLKLAEELLALKRMAKQTNNAKSYYLLGNAYYNMTYFGNIWYAIDYTKSYTISRSSEYDIVFLDCSKALEYYEKAIDLSKDKELSAECSFLASKCEQNNYYMKVLEKSYYVDATVTELNKQKSYFNKFKQEYSDTQYYQEAISECEYLDRYVNDN